MSRGWRCAHEAGCAAQRLPQPGILPWGREPEIVIRARCGDTATRRAIEKALLDEERLVHVLDRVFLFVNGGGKAVDAHRAAAELVDDRAQELPVDFVEAVVVDLEELHRRAGDVRRDVTVGADLREVTHPRSEARRGG